MLRRRVSSKDLTNNLRLSRSDWRVERTRSSIPIDDKERSTSLLENNKDTDASATAISNTTMSAEYEIDQKSTDRRKYSSMHDSSSNRSPRDDLIVDVSPSDWV